METQKMQIQPSHLLFSGIRDADLVRAFAENIQDRKEAERRIAEKYYGSVIVQTKFWGKR